MKAALVALLGACQVVPSQPAVVTPSVVGARVSTERRSATHPSIARAGEGRLFVSWLEWSEAGDEIKVASRAGSDWSPPQSITRAPGQLIRPLLAAAAGQLFCFWTASHADRPAAIWYSRLDGKEWSVPARLLPRERRAHLNPEVASAPDGRLALVYQLHDGRHYHIHLLAWENGRWSASRQLSRGDGNDWDPAVAFDGKGGLDVAWSAFRDDDYDVVWTRVRGGEVSAARRLSSPGSGENDLHPSLASAPDGSVWASWDAIAIASYGSSGDTTITGANLERRRPTADRIGIGGAISAIEVRRLDGARVQRVGNSRTELVAPPGYLFGHGAMARIFVAPSGAPWVVYRALRRGAAEDEHYFWWDAIARPLGGEPVRLEGSDGFLDEVAAAATPGGLVVAYGGERRYLGTPRLLDGGAPLSRPGWTGEIFAATLPAVAPTAAPPVEVAAPLAAGGTAEPMRYSVRNQGKRYQLLWGDTHRHSNLSRCSEGGEPRPDDLYRYAEDVDRYDFFALSDHMEDLGDQNWWREQALADLYDLPGAFSVLYDFEWSMGFPEGHHNTLFANRPTLRLDSDLAASSTRRGGWALLAAHGLRAITIPHTSATADMGTDWSVNDERYLRLVEVFQACRGSFEHRGCPRQSASAKKEASFYWNALEKGIHAGVIASSDHGWGVSYACVYAEANTRQAVFDALWERRTYGASAYGTLLDVRSGAHWMGEVWRQKEAPAIDVYVRATEPIRSIEIIGRSRVLYAEGLDQPLGVRERRLRWVDPDWDQQTREQWYYVRVIRSDDEMAWSSPIWVSHL